MPAFSRRHFLAASLAAPLAAQPAPLVFSVFSKHLHFLPVPDMAAAARDMGFGGIDLTVRKGGHIAPERAAEDLPAAAEAIRKAGLQLSMITTDIADVTTPHAETVLRTAAKLGVAPYRWGGFRYQDGGAPIAEQLASFKPKVKELAALNREIGVCAMYHTHSGVNQVGASQWDLWMLLQDQSPSLVSFNYDIAHATIEGGLGGWLHSTRLALPLTRGIALKDFLWERTAHGGKVKWCPVGEGLVQFDRFFTLMKRANFGGPLQVHFEYELGGADKGARQITVEHKVVFAAMRRDLQALERLLAAA